jgi:hypothetical protein
VHTYAFIAAGTFLANVFHDISYVISYRIYTSLYLSALLCRPLSLKLGPLASLGWGIRTKEFGAPVTGHKDTLVTGPPWVSRIIFSLKNKEFFVFRGYEAP